MLLIMIHVKSNYFTRCNDVDAKLQILKERKETQLMKKAREDRLYFSLRLSQNLELMKDQAPNIL